MQNKRTRIMLGAIIAVCSAVFVLSTNSADAVSQVSNVKSRCTEIQASLNQLEENDTLLRYTVGSKLLIISDKLMSPLNQRIASNQLDGSALLEISSAYNKSYDGKVKLSFYEAYRKYENSLRDVMEIDCTKRPEDFLSKLDVARQNRIALHTAFEEQLAIAKKYQKALKKFTDEYKKGNV